MNGKDTNEKPESASVQSLVMPRLLDLFCGAGGCSMGYHRAGFEVVGVDIEPQPNYPFEFVQADAIEYVQTYGKLFDVIHSSPPCQQFTAYRRRGSGVGDGYKDLIPTTRRELMGTGKPWIIENINGSTVQAPFMLCGSSFGLDVRRHRYFESSQFMLTPPCEHGRQAPRFKQATNRTNLRRTVEVGVWRIPLATQQAAMGIDWMTLEELSQAIPPAYTEWIGRKLIAS